MGLRRTSEFDGSVPGKGPSCTRIPPLKYQKKGLHKQALILGISIEEHKTLMKDLSPLAVIIFKPQEGIPRLELLTELCA